MHSRDMEYIDQEIKFLCRKIQSLSWLRLKSACAGHKSGTPNASDYNLLTLEVDVLDADRFLSLRDIMDKKFTGVVWGGVVSNDRINYRFSDQEEQENFINFLVKVLDEV